MATPIQQYSFAGGEIAPGLWARGDLQKYHNGAALLLNHFVDVRGGVSNRPGTQFVGRSTQGNCGNNNATTTPPTSQFGTITGWINPVGMRDEGAGAQLCSGNQIVFTNNFESGSDLAAGSLTVYFQNQGTPNPPGTTEQVFPGKLNIVARFDQLYGPLGEAGDQLKSFVISAGQFRGDPAGTYLDMPDNGFPWALTWDFTGNNWGAHLYMGFDDGSWTRIDNDAYCTSQILPFGGGPIVPGTTNPVAFGAALHPDFSFFTSSTNTTFGLARDLFFNFGADEGYLGNHIPYIPLHDPFQTDKWDICEYAQTWFGFGQAIDMSDIANARLFWSDSSTPKWAPKDLGTGGATPTGTAPVYYFRRGLEAGDIYTNDGVANSSLPLYQVDTAGSGGSGSPTAPVNASTIPADGSYQALGVRFGTNNGAAKILPANFPAVATGRGCGEPGSAVCEIPPPRLIPFTFSTVQTYALEFGDLYMRPIKDGGYVLEPSFAISAATQADPVVLTTATNDFVDGDWVFVTGILGMTELNNRTLIVVNATSTTVELETLDGDPVDSTTYTAYASGGTIARLFTLDTPYIAADLPLLKFCQSADVLTITHPSYAPRDLTRTQHWVWTLTAITFAPDINPPTGFTVTGDNSGSTTYRYVVTAVSQTSSEESRPSAIAQITNALAMSINAGERVHIKWLPVAGAAYYNVYRQPEVTRGAPDWGQQYGFIGTTTGVSMTDQNILPDFSRSPPQARNPFANSPIRYWTISNGGHGYATGLATVTDATGSGWLGFIEATGGVVTAIVTQYGGQDYTAPTISAAGGSGLAATATLGPATGNWPACVSYFQQRKVFAATNNAPETLWMTQIGNFNNMDVSVPARDSDAITATISSTQVNAIKFLLPMASGLIVGSSSGAWQVSGGSVGEPVTPSNIVASPQAFNGASDVPPIPVNYDILYVQSKSNVVRDLTYNFYVNNYVGADMTVLSNHLFYGFAVEEWAYQDEPCKVVWGIRDDGILLSFSFLKEQEVYAWCHSDTQGKWKSTASISEGDENAVYLVAQRTIPGVNVGQPVYYTERMASRQMKRPWTNPDLNNGADVVNAWFLDCALRYGPDLGEVCITPSALTGTITLTTDGDAFTTASVGDIVRLNGGIMTIATYTSATVVAASVIVDLISTDLAVAGDWTMTAPVTEVDGLDHLIGASVMVLSNGSVEGPYTVSSTGTVTLSAASDIALVGLAYTPKGQTLYLDTGSPTIAGKRKAIPGVTVFVENTRGLKLSSSGFDNLVAMKERTNEQMGQPTRLTTGQERINVYSDWTTGGQVYWQQDYPLPCTVLSVVPEVSIGDTAGRDG